MSMESARAFCVRLMSDEDFRNQVVRAKDMETIKTLTADYSFVKAELEKVIGEFVGHKLEIGELSRLIGDFFAEQLEGGPGESCQLVLDWLEHL